jgi:hypothetical protein
MGRRRLTPAEVRAYRALARAARRLRQAQDDAERQRGERALGASAAGIAKGAR